MFSATTGGGTEVRFVDPIEQRVRDLERDRDRMKLEQTWIREQFYKLKAEVDAKVQVIPHMGKVNDNERPQ